MPLVENQVEPDDSLFWFLMFDPAKFGQNSTSENPETPAFWVQENLYFYSGNRLMKD